MDNLESLSKLLDNIKFTNQNLRLQVPCPQSVARYLDYQNRVNGPNKLVKSFTTSSSPTDSVNRELFSVMEKHNEEPPETRLRRRPRKRLQKKRQKAMDKTSISNSSLNEQNKSNIEPIGSKYFYPDYMMKEDVIKGLESGQLFEGCIRISQKCYSEAYVPSPDKSKDILINSILLRNRALNGDQVVVKILEKSEWRNPDTANCQRTGEVVYITKRKENHIIVGTLVVEKGNSRFSSLLPKDQRFPKLVVNTSTWPIPITLRSGTRESTELYYAILQYWNKYKFPKGILKGVLGVSGDINAETKGILLEHEIQEEPYPKDIHQYFPPEFSTEEELKHRKDFRKHCIFTIDPPTAKDLDDALSCVLLPNGNYEIGIHIADVSHFVKHGTPLDSIAQESATSVYLVQRVYHMLPPALTMMASLLPGTDKLAVSVILEMTPDANIISHSFCRSIINSCGQLHYPHAQIFLENPDKNIWNDSEFPTIYNGYTINDCAKAVCHLHKLATVMRKRRFDTGALAINQPKLSFEIDPATCEPFSYSLYLLHESNWLIEEFMLLANTLVAEHLKTHFPTTALLRNHQPPDYAQMEKTISALKAHGINIDGTSAGSIQKSKALYYENMKSDNSHWDLVINNSLSKPMVRAEYCVISSGVDMTHFALNVPYYTHFTSPIRRYPDIVVHRLLISWLTGTSIEEYENPDIIHQIATNSNDKKNNAKKASEASAEIYAAYLIGKLGEIEEFASVMEVKENYFEAIVLSMNITVRVYVNVVMYNPDLEHDSCQFAVVDDRPTLTIVWDTENDVKQTIQLFSKVKLKLTKKKNCMKLRAVLIRNN